MKKLKLSQWHDGSVKPVHVGIYEIDDHKNGYGGFYSWFDGEMWHYTSTKEVAFDRRTSVTCTQDKKWQGIVK